MRACAEATADDGTPRCVKLADKSDMMTTYRARQSASNDVDWSSSSSVCSTLDVKCRTENATPNDRSGKCKTKNVEAESWTPKSDG